MKFPQISPTNRAIFAWSLRAQLVLLSLALGMTTSSSRAADFTWRSVATTVQPWSTGTNWASQGGTSTAPGAGDNAVFNGTGTATVSLTTPLSSGGDNITNLAISANETFLAGTANGTDALTVSSTFGVTAGTVVVRDNNAGVNVNLLDFTANAVSVTGGAVVDFGNPSNNALISLNAYSATTTTVSGAGSIIAFNVLNSTASLGDLTVGSGATARLLVAAVVGGTSATLTAKSLTGAGTVQVNGAAGLANVATLNLTTSGTTATFSGALNNGGVGTTAVLNLTMNGSGTQVLTGANAYTGTTTINSGVLQYGDGITNGTMTGTAAAYVLNSGTLAYDASGFQALGTLITGNGTVLIEGGTVAFATGAGNAYTGTTMINAGATLQVGNFSTTGTLSANAVTVDNGTLLYAKTQQPVFGGQITGTGGVVVNMINVGATSSGTLTLSGSNSYTGGTTIENGMVKVNTAFSLGDGALTLTSGTLDLNSRAPTITTLSGSSTGVITNSNAGALGTVSSSSSINSTYDGVIIDGGGPVALTYRGTGTTSLTLTNSGNTYSGTTKVNGGTLIVTANNALGSAAAGTVVSSGAALLLNNANYSTAEALSLSGTGNGNGGALINTGTSTFAGAITAAANTTITAGGIGNVLNLTGGITKDGTVLTVAGGGTVNVSGVGISGASANSDLVVDNSTLNVSAASTYNGPTTVQNNGILQLGADNVLPTAPSTPVTLNTGGQFDLAGHSDSVASLAGDSTGKVTNTASTGTSTLTVNGSGVANFSGVIEDGTSGAKVALIKSGLGAQTLSGNNTYTGATVVSAGSLLVSGGLSSSSAVTVAGGATLGVGKAAGAGSFKTLTVASLDTGSGGGESIISLSLDSTGNDELVTTGAFTLNGGEKVDLALTISGSIALGTQYTLMNWGSLGFTDLTTQLDLAGSSPGVSLNEFSLSGNDLIFTSAVPEPSTWALIGLGAVSLVFLRRRQIRCGL